jgi:hypothetical protein
VAQRRDRDSVFPAALGYTVATDSKSGWSLSRTIGFYRLRSSSTWRQTKVQKRGSASQQTFTRGYFLRAAWSAEAHKFSKCQE